MRVACPAENRRFPAYPRLVVIKSPSALARAARLAQLSRESSQPAPPRVTAFLPWPPPQRCFPTTLYFLFSRLIGLLAVGFAISGRSWNEPSRPPSDRIKLTHLPLGAVNA